MTNAGVSAAAFAQFCSAALLASRALFCAVFYAGVRVVNRCISVSSGRARCQILDPCELRVLLRLPTPHYASALSVWLVHRHELRDHGVTLVVCLRMQRCAGGVLSLCGGTIAERRSCVS